jgi:TolB-like protein/tetratricopeptide (TPR) repeat protein
VSFFEELKRRNVIKVAIAYVVVAWLVMQFTDVVLNNIEAPDWVFLAIMLVLGIGFLFALFFSWAFEMTPEGLKRDHEVDRTQSITQQTGKKLNNLIFVVMALALGYFLYDKLVLSTARDAALVEATTRAVTAQTTAETEATMELENSIAVLPFVNMSGDEDYFADGLSEELLNLLAKIPDLKVTARTSSFKFKGQNEDLRLIGNALNVTKVLEGSVRRSGARLRVTAQLINVADGYHLWSETYDREMIDIFEMQDDIAANIIRSLKLQLHDGVGAPTSGLPTASMEAYQLYLEAKGLPALFESNLPAGEAAAKYRRALTLDPNFIEAHIGLAEDLFDRAGLGMPYDEAAAIAREHAAAVLAIDPDHLWARTLWAYAQPPIWNVEETVTLLREAEAADPNNIFAFQWLMYSLVQLGYGQETLDRINTALQRDPLATYLQFQRSQALRILGRDKESMAAMLESADSDTTYTFYWFVLEALSDSKDAEATAFMEKYAARSGELPEDVRRHFKRLVDTETRDEEIANPGLKSVVEAENSWDKELPYLFYMLGDQRIWDEFAEAVFNNNPDSIVAMIMVQHNPVFLNDTRFRKWADERGFTAFWSKHGVPDFCDGSIRSWVCELDEVRTTR